MKNISAILLFVLTVSLMSYAQFGKGDIVFKINDKIGDVLFSHKVHTGILNINCEYCHNFLLKQYIEEAKNKKKKLSDVLDKLFCNNCHNGEKIFSTDGEKSCKKCHHVVEREKSGKKSSN